MYSLPRNTTLMRHRVPPQNKEKSGKSAKTTRIHPLAPVRRNPNSGVKLTLVQIIQTRYKSRALVTRVVFSRQYELVGEDRSLAVTVLDGDGDVRVGCHVDLVQRTGVV